MQDFRFEFAVACGTGLSVVAGLAVHSYIDKTGKWVTWDTPLRQRLASNYITSGFFAHVATKNWNQVAGVISYLACMVVFTHLTQAYNSQDVLGKDKTAPWKHEVVVGGAAAVGGLIGFVCANYLLQK